MTAADVWIIGGGRFGRRAAEVLARSRPKGALLVVDHDKASLAEVRQMGVHTIEEDGAGFLARGLKPEDGPKWIVPCLPVHLAFEWLKLRLGPKSEPLPVPPRFAYKLPNPLPADQGGYYMSYADFLCPDDCPEPADICTYTGRPRQGTLFKDLAAMTWPGYSLLVLRSRQLAPGLGGYRRGELFDLEQKARRAGGPLLIATACRCHGVLHGLRVN